MPYANRLKFALLLSCVLHVGALAYLGPRNPVFGLGDEAEPQALVLNLEAPEARSPKQLVEISTPSEAATPDTDLIAEEDAEAADTELRSGEEEGPRLEEQAEFDSLPQTPAQATPEIVQAVPEKAAEVPMQEVPEKAPPEAETGAEIAQLAPPPEALDDLTEALMAPFEVAQAVAAAPEDSRLAKSRGRIRDAIKNQGSTNFEAMQSEIAPYLKEVRRKVELRWNQALMTKYPGSSPAEATIDCVIAPDGRLVSAAVVGEARDRAYAALCKEAIERAGPFKSFPFLVPDYYRNRNLEIRWTFSFL